MQKKKAPDLLWIKGSENRMDMGIRKEERWKNKISLHRIRSNFHSRHLDWSGSLRIGSGRRRTAPLLSERHPAFFRLPAVPDDEKIPLFPDRHPAFFRLPPPSVAVSSGFVFSFVHPSIPYIIYIYYSLRTKRTNNIYKDVQRGYI